MDNLFIEQWRTWLQTAEIILGLLGVLLLVLYYLRMITISEPKRKYDFINNKEITVLKRASLLITMSLALLLDNLLSLQFESPEVFPFLIGVGVALMLAFLVFMGIKTTLEVYYPKFLGKRLDAIRYTPRISPKSGKKMKLLNEEEEDTYLTDEMQVEEESLIFDYDVWYDDETGYTQIEKFDGRKSLSICPNCKYRTLHETSADFKNELRTEIMTRNYECSYCNHREQKEFNISHIESSVENSESDEKSA